MRRTKDSSDKLDGFASVGGTLKMSHEAWLPQLYGLPSFQLSAIHTHTHTNSERERERETPTRATDAFAPSGLEISNSNSNFNFTKKTITLCKV